MLAYILRMEISLDPGAIIQAGLPGFSFIFCIQASSDGSAIYACLGISPSNGTASIGKEDSLPGTWMIDKVTGSIRLLFPC